MLSINRVGDEREPAPVTLPRLPILDKAPADDIKETAARFAEQRIISAGIDAWQAIGKADSFENWKSIGAALSIGKAHALRVTGANRACGRNYSRVFGEWIKTHHFDRMAKSVRSGAIELHENVHAIEQWRASLTDRERRRLTHPLSNVRRWRAATAQPKTSPEDALKAAAAAWRRFVACVEALPADQAQPLWRAAQAETAARCNMV